MNIYQSLFELVQTYIFGGAELAGTTLLCADFVATAGSLLVIALPFLIVWKVIKLLVG